MYNLWLFHVILIDFETLIVLPDQLLYIIAEVSISVYVIVVLVLWQMNSS